MNNKSKSGKRLRVLIAKLGLDYHAAGAKLIARELRDAGIEVIYTGLFQTPEAVVKTALQEDVDLVGISILSGAHNTLIPELMELLKSKNLDIPVLVGGIIPAKDIPFLKNHGVLDVFGPETMLSQIVEYINHLFRIKKQLSATEV